MGTGSDAGGASTSEPLGEPPFAWFPSVDLAPAGLVPTGGGADAGTSSDAGLAPRMDASVDVSVDAGASRPVATAGAPSGATTPSEVDAGASSGCPACRRECETTRCLPAVDGCSALLGSTTLTSGLYWIGAGQTAHRGYCEAGTGLELCSEETEERTAISLDEGALPFAFTSVLEGDACKIGNVRAQSDQRPLDALETFDANLRFVTVGPLPGARLRSGYRLQGEIYQSTIPWDATGAYAVYCGT